MGTKNNPGAFDCLANAKPDEPFFVMLGRDNTAPLMTDRWAEYREREIHAGIRPQSDMAQVAEARQCAADMRKWREDNFPNWRNPPSEPPKASAWITNNGVWLLCRLRGVRIPPHQGSSGSKPLHRTGAKPLYHTGGRVGGTADYAAPEFIRAGGTIPQPFGTPKGFPTPTLYVCGLCFSEDRKQVLLIRKERPHWMAGKLNGIGGMIEPGETPEHAMIREAGEEAGPGMVHVNWEPLCGLTGIDFHVWFFAAFDDRCIEAIEWQNMRMAANRRDNTGDLRHQNGKKVEFLFMAETATVSGLPIMDNLATIIPLALDTSGIVKPVMLLDKVPNAVKATPGTGTA